MLKRLTVSAVAALTLVGLMAGPALAITNYSLTVGSGASYALRSGASHNLFSGTHDDDVVNLTTTSSGQFKLPFALHFYGVNWTSVWVSTNGNIQFGGSSGNIAWSNDCLPSSTITAPMLAVIWDDLYLNTADTSHFFQEGVFTKTSGTVGHKKWTVSWQTHLFSDETSVVLAQATFFQTSNKIKLVYGAGGGSSSTIGVQQGGAGLFKQFTCNSGVTAVSAGTSLTFNR